MLCASLAHLSHSFGGLIGGVFEHYRDIIDPADAASGFDQNFQLASRVHFYCSYVGGLSACGTTKAARRSSAIGNREGVPSIGESGNVLADS